MNTFADFFWAMITFYFIFMIIWIFIRVFADLFHRQDLSGAWKVIWILVIFVIPFFGALVYIISRPKLGADTETAVARARRRRRRPQPRPRPPPMRSPSWRRSGIPGRSPPPSTTPPRPKRWPDRTSPRAGPPLRLRTARRRDPRET